MKYAVIKTGGKQYKVAPGQVLQVEKLDSDGESVVFEEVLLVVEGDKVEVGMPTVSDVKVFASVVAEVKGEKIEVFKYKSKSRYRKHTGHRQKYTQVKIDSIGAKRETKVTTKAKEVVIPSVVEGSKTKAVKAPAAKKTPVKKPVTK